METIQAIDQGWQTYGYLGAIAVTLTALVGLVKHPIIQRVLPETAKWGNLKPWVKLAVIFGAAAIGSGLLAYLGGLSKVAAVGAAISAGFTAIGVRESKETLKSKVVESPFRSTSLKTELKPLEEMKTSSR